MVVCRLREEHPGCDIRLFEEETDQLQVSDLDLLFFDGRAGGDLQHLKLLDDPYLPVARPGAFPSGPVPLAPLGGAPMVAYPPICDEAGSSRNRTAPQCPKGQPREMTMKLCHADQ